MIEAIKPVSSTMGEGEKLGQLTRENWPNFLVRLGQVKNIVLWANPYIEIPFRLEVGQPTPLGLFAERTLKEVPESLREDKFVGEAWPSHNRSLLLGRVALKDNKGREYRDIDLKGSGYLINPSDGFAVGWSGYESWGRRNGLLDKESAEHDRNTVEKLLDFDIRTNQTLAIIELNEVIDNGKAVSVREFTSMHNIPDKFEPVLEVRAFRTKSRISDLHDKDIAIRKLLVEDAKKLVSEEIGLSKTMSDKEYVEWFAKTIGRNVGLLHLNGLSHGYLTTHNITLDASIVDLDSVDKLVIEHGVSNERRISRDLDALKGSLAILSDDLSRIMEFDKLRLMHEMKEWCRLAYMGITPEKKANREQKYALIEFGNE